MTKANTLIICPTTAEMDARLAEHFAPVWLKDTDADWLTRDGASIDYVLTDGHLGVTAKLFAGLPNLRAIGCYGVGYDNINTDTAVARGIPVSHTPDVLNQEVATTALMLMIACLRNFPAQVDHATSGAWGRGETLPLARSADGLTIGILGLGRIGKTIVEKLMPFAPTILYTGRSKQDVPYEFIPDLKEMAAKADVLISIVPGGDGTRNLIDRAVMDALGPRGVLINVGRGTTVDEPELIKALTEGRLGHAGLDVFEAEPQIPEALRALPNAVLIPHIGSATVETRRAMGNLAIDNLIEHERSGRLLTPVPECRDLV